MKKFNKRSSLAVKCTPKVRLKTFGVFFMKYSYEQRLIIVNRVKQGEAFINFDVKSVPSIIQLM
ncbi:hypothetical protein NSB1T_11955 [Coprobacter fastidiosus NSB1 = JCM 33896]|nr:hypothetical protein NSB1T_11955 [Coprobacter fastidiosus NSB1 = JCM 33896]